MASAMGPFSVCGGQQGACGFTRFGYCGPWRGSWRDGWWRSPSWREASVSELAIPRI
jgi:hypothetical protein